MTRAGESNARDDKPISALAHALHCRYCDKPIYVVICRDGKWRSFEPVQVPAAPRNVWAWRKRLGMEETDKVPGHRLHFCAEYSAAAMRIDLSGIVPNPNLEDER